MISVPYIWQANIWFGESLSQFISIQAGTPQEIRQKASDFLLSTKPAAFSNYQHEASDSPRICYFHNAEAPNEGMSNLWCFVQQSKTGHEPQYIGTFEDAVRHFVNRALIIGYEIDQHEYEARKTRNQQEQLEGKLKYREILQKHEERRKVERDEFERLIAEQQEAKRQEALRLELLIRKIKRRETMRLASERHEAAMHEDLQKRAERREIYQLKTKQVQAARRENTRRAAIRKFIEERGIKNLVHFTHIDNLSSIMNFGLLSRTYLERSHDRKLARFNDDLRIDGHKNAISLSISFPNYKLFFKWSHNEREDWVVLSIKPDVLWEKESLFFPTNAASNKNRSAAKTYARSVESLYSLFGDYQDSDRQISRKLLNLSADLPTNPQAEILVFSPIEPVFITAISFHNQKCADRWINQHPLSSCPAIEYGGKFFSFRNDFNHW